MSTFNTDLDSINNICSLVGEILQLSLDIHSRTENEQIIKDCELIVRKATTIKTKAQKMEDRLHQYRGAIEDLGFKRVREKRGRSK